MSDKAKVAIQLSLQGASEVARGLGTVVTGASKISSGFERAGATAFHFIQIGKDITNMARRMAAGVGSAFDALISPNQNMEVAQLQFEQLMGSADAAKERIRLLYDYANRTPFMNPDVVRGGKILQAFGGDALGAGKALEMTGDMAAYANTDLSEIATWVGRAYSAIQGGRPFGEAAQRLQELTLLTGTERAQLEALSESGANASQVWDAFTKIMGKTQGSAGRLANSMQGVKSTLSGYWGEIKRMTGEKVFDTFKGELLGLRNELDTAFATGQIEKWTTRAGTAINDFFTLIKENAIGDLGLTDMLKVADQGDLLGGLKEGLAAAVKNFWEMMVFEAQRNSPAIQRMLIPDRLHGLFGLTKGREKAVAAMAGGDTSFSNRQKAHGTLGAAARINPLIFGPAYSAYALATGKVNWSGKSEQNWAQQQQPQKPRLLDVPTAFYRGASAGVDRSGGARADGIGELFNTQGELITSWQAEAARMTAEMKGATTEARNVANALRDAAAAGARL